MKLLTESTVVNDGKLNTNIDNVQTNANNTQAGVVDCFAI